MGTTRRIVLFGGAAVGALVVGYAIWPGNRPERLTALDGKPGEKFFGNWIKIASDDTVTVVVPHCDMGTGIYTALPQMAADELDVNWEAVRVEAAPPDPLFANGPLGEGFILTGMNIAPEKIPTYLRATVDNSFRAVAAYMNLQVTGGSASVRATGMLGLRAAGAAAREMLVKAAAEKWGVAPSDCTTKSGRVIHIASGKEFRYGELIDDAATYTPSPTPRLKTRDQFRLIGKSIPRIDIPNKVNGTTTYGVDVKVPDMLYAAIRISPVFGGKLVSVDSAPIKGKRGIAKVVKLDDAVVVVADRFWRARDAVAALNPLFDNGGNGNVDSKVLAARHAAALKGEVKSDLKKGAGSDALVPGKVVEATYNVPYLSHAPMEPVNATALYKDGTLEVWSGTQDGLGSRAWCSKVSGVPFEKVTFHLLHSGGAFGRRLPGQWNFLDYAVKTAMAMEGRPVKLIFTREQDMQHGWYRPNITSRLRGSIGKDGMPVAWVNDYVGWINSTDPMGGNPANPEAHILYDIPNQAIGTVAAETHVPTAPWRSVEASWHGFFIESFIDELAHSAGKDPYRYRRALLASHPRHAATLDLVAEKSGWGTPLPPGQGRGIAMVESFGSIVAHVAQVEVTKDGTLKVTRITSAIDPGMAVNPDGLKAQIEGGIIYGLTAALYDEITLDKGAVVQSSFPDYPMVRLADCPEIEVHIHESDGPVGGAGEPGVPPVAPAVANAVYAATGVRVRALPFSNHDLKAEMAHIKAA